MLWLEAVKIKKIPYFIYLGYNLLLLFNLYYHKYEQYNIVEESDILC